MIEIPEYLYHYTTVETLALILKNKTMRFNSLRNLDDLEEVKSKDGKLIGERIFVTCFTVDSEESIPIWNMYAKNGEGIRIKFRSAMFEGEDIQRRYYVVKDKNEIYEVNNSNREDVIKDKSNKISMFMFPNLPQKVRYTDEEEEIVPIIENRKADNGFSIEYDPEHSFDLSRVGICKRKAWSFQEEFRFAGIFIDDCSRREKEDLYEEPAIFYLDLSILEETIKNIEITLGYNMSPGDREIVEILKEKFNKENDANISIKESCFKDRIKMKG